MQWGREGKWQPGGWEQGGSQPPAPSPFSGQSGRHTDGLEYLQAAGVILVTEQHSVKDRLLLLKGSLGHCPSPQVEGTACAKAGRRDCHPRAVSGPRG